MLLVLIFGDETIKIFEKGVIVMTLPVKRPIDSPNGVN